MCSQVSSMCIACVLFEQYYIWTKFWFVWVKSYVLWPCLLRCSLHYLCLKNTVCIYLILQLDLFPRSKQGLWNHLLTLESSSVPNPFPPSSTTTKPFFCHCRFDSISHIGFSETVFATHVLMNIMLSYNRRLHIVVRKRFQQVQKREMSLCSRCWTGPLQDFNPQDRMALNQQVLQIRFTAPIMGSVPSLFVESTCRRLITLNWFVNTNVSVYIVLFVALW